jgi:hypothetical protein
MILGCEEDLRQLGMAIGIGITGCSDVPLPAPALEVAVEKALRLPVNAGVINS